MNKKYAIETNVEDFDLSINDVDWTNIIKVQYLNCRKSKENDNEKVRSKFQKRGIEALGRHWCQESMRTA